MRRIGATVLTILLIATSAVMGGGQKESVKPEKVSILAWWTVRKPIMELTKVEVKNFEADNPHISVELLGMPEDALQQKLIGATQAGIGPDVVYIDEGVVKVMYNAKILQPIPEDVYTEDQILKMYGPKAKMSKLNGRYYGFPNGDMAAVMFYNVDVLKNHGIDPANLPDTWGEIIPLAQKMTDLDKDIQGFPIRGRESSMWNALLFQGGGFLFRNEKEAMFADEPGKKAFEFLHAIYDTYKTSSRTSLSANESFGQGKSGFAYNWTWYIGTLKTNYPDINFETRTLPTPTGKPPYGSYGPSYGLFVSSTDPKKKDAAWEFWKFVTSPDFQLKWSMLRGLIPARLEAHKPEIFGKQPYKAVADAVANGISYSFYPDAVGNLILGTMVSEIMEGAPIMQTMKKTQDEVNRYLKDYSDDCWIYGKAWHDK